MTDSLIAQYSKEELEVIVKNSCSWRGLGRKLGYTFFSGALKNQIEKYLQEQDISTSHFTGRAENQIARTEENIFIENSTAAQQTLRRWYLAGEYTEYKCSICGQEPMWNGQELSLILDHINGINNDDRLENLRWVCPNCNMQLPTTGSRNMKKEKQVKKYYCLDCGAEVTKGSTRCISCNSKYRTIPLENMPVDRQTLKDLIRSTPLIKVGEMFMVSDNTIRKWCDKFNLPRRASEIKKYSDEEWEKI